MDLFELPVDLMTAVTNMLSSADLSTFARTRKRLYKFLNAELYHRDIRDRGNETLKCACLGISGTWRTVESSLDAGADIESLFDAGCEDPFSGYAALTPFQLKYNNEDVVRLLVERGANTKRPYSGDPERWMPLHVASAHGLRSTMKLLIEKGADINAHTQRNFTPVHCAISFGPAERPIQGHVDAVKLLIREGAAPCCRDWTSDGVNRLFSDDIRIRQTHAQTLREGSIEERAYAEQIMKDCMLTYATLKIKQHRLTPKEANKVKNLFAAWCVRESPKSREGISIRSNELWRPNLYWAE